VIIVLFVAIVSTASFNASFHLTKASSQQNASTSTSLGWSGVDHVKTYSTMAIVTPPVAKSKRLLQTEIANALKEKLTKTKLVYDVDRKAKRYTSSYPKVTNYSGLDEAKKQKPDFYLIVQPKVWRHRPFSLCARQGAATRG
jgi:hypothetical protein